MEYIILFLVSFVSGSLAPLGSEGLLIYYLSDSNLSSTALIVSATLGNSLGAILNYFLGLKGEEFLKKRGFLKEESIKKAKEKFDKYGLFALLLSPLPIVGDPITFIAGSLKFNFKLFVLVVTFAKFIRYIALFFIYIAI